MENNVPFIRILKNIISSEESSKLQSYLTSLPFVQYETFLYGRKVNVPRKQLILGDKDVKYRYNDILMTAIEWNDDIKNIPKKYLPWIKESFNCTLVNLYRDQNDHVSAHRDDTRSFSNNFILSVSLGETRTFILSDNINEEIYHMQINLNDILIRKDKKFELILEDGDILFFNQKFNEIFKHSIKKEKKKKKPRYNLTYRNL